MCLGKRPAYGEKTDLEHGAGLNWPTFDPSGRDGQLEMQGALPDLYTDVDADELDGAAGGGTNLNEREPTLAGSSTPGPKTGALSSDQSHYPDYSHLDPPELQEQRARQVAETAAASNVGTNLVSDYTSYYPSEVAPTNSSSASAYAHTYPPQQPPAPQSTYNYLYDQASCAQPYVPLYTSDPTSAPMMARHNSPMVSSEPGTHVADHDEQTPLVRGQ